jgi:hypothetical protein
MAYNSPNSNPNYPNQPPNNLESDPESTTHTTHTAHTANNNKKGVKAIYRQSSETINSKGREMEREIAAGKLRLAQFSGRPNLPWDAPSLKFSPTGN